MGAGSHWHRALECSTLLINQNQSCAITSIFLVNYREGQVVQLHTGACGMWAQEKHLVLQSPTKEQDGHRKKKSQAHQNICWRPNIEAVVSLIIYRRHTLLPLNTNERGSMHTQWKLPPFSSCENEIQGHKDNTRLSLRPLLPFV